jgi:hypothetical protein
MSIDLLYFNAVGHTASLFGGEDGTVIVAWFLDTIT